MRIREDNRNLVLLATVALCCAMVAGTAALIDPAGAPLRTERLADNGPVSVDQSPVDQASVRVIGTPFVPNVNPRER
jgi:hypothetical protein